MWAFHDYQKYDKCVFKCSTNATNAPDFMSQQIDLFCTSLNDCYHAPGTRSIVRNNIIATICCSTE